MAFSVWTEHGLLNSPNFFHYSTNAPIADFWSVVGDLWVYHLKSTNLQITF